VTISVAALLGCWGLVACSGSSSSPTTKPTPTPAASRPLPENTAARDATVSLPATAVIQVGHSSALTLTTTHSDQLTVTTTPAGAQSISVSMHDQHSDLFTIDGPAKAGTTTRTAHVVVFVKHSGVLLDTASEGSCRTSYTTVSETAVQARISCSLPNGSGGTPVTVTLTTSG